MTEALLPYRSLESRLRDTRWRHSGDESRKEDAILDEMEQAWLKLSDEERRLLRAEGPTCWPTGPSRPAYPPAPRPAVSRQNAGGVAPLPCRLIVSLAAV